MWWGNPRGGREKVRKRKSLGVGGGGGLCNRKVVAPASAGITSEMTAVYQLNMATAKQLINAVRRLSVASRNSHKA